MKSIVFLRSAEKALLRLPHSVQQDLRAKLRRFVETGHGDVRRLTGRAGYRLRSGEYRLIFDRIDGRLVVEAVGHRSDLYR